MESQLIKTWIHEACTNPRSFPPNSFVQHMGLQHSSLSFCVAAWQLFQEVERPISMNEVREYIQTRHEPGIPT
jgi:hypothetical protein